MLAAPNSLGKEMNSVRPPEGEPGRDTTNCLTGRVVLLFRHTIPPEYPKTRFEKTEYAEINGSVEIRRSMRLEDCQCLSLPLSLLNEKVATGPSAGGQAGP